MLICLIIIIIIIIIIYIFELFKPHGPSLSPQGFFKNSKVDMLPKPQDAVDPQLSKQFNHSGWCVRAEQFAACIKQLRTAVAGGLTSYQAVIPRDRTQNHLLFLT